jgi:hypothetical protein
MQMITLGPDGKAVQEDFAWSYSHIKNFETCPHRYEQLDLLKKFQEDESQELKDGFYIHDCLAKRIAHNKPLPPHVPYEKWAQYVLSMGGNIMVEQKLAMTKHFKPCAYFDKIKKVWLRSVADVLRISGKDCHIIDWKTGKVKPDKDQLMLACTVVMAHHPQIFNIRAEFVWLAFDTQTVMDCTVDDVVKYWGDTMFEKVAKLQDARRDNHFPKKKSGLCRAWCAVTSCEHCGQ